MDLGRQTKAAQLAEKLHGELLAERLPAGSPVMSARELAQKFSISTVTANRILNRLVESDVLYRVPQSGTFVKHDPPAIPVIAYAGVLPSPASNDPIKNAAAAQLQESFTALGIEPRILSYHTLSHRALAKRELQGTNGLLLDAAFIDPETIKLLWEYPGPIVTFNNCYIVEELACCQVIPDFTKPMLEFHRIYGFDSYDRILLVEATHRNAKATAAQLRHILTGIGIPEDRIESVKISAQGPIQPCLKAFRYFSDYDRSLENTLILSLSDFFAQGIREAYFGKCMPDILSFDNLESYQKQDEKPFFTSIDRRLGQIECKALELLMKQIQQPDDEFPIIRIPARLVLRRSVRKTGRKGER